MLMKVFSKREINSKWNAFGTDISKERTYPAPRRPLLFRALAGIKNNNNH